ncbi:MAG: host attachment protein [Legionella sp.]|nr:host attachment protein [Legionella sp.]
MKWIVTANTNQCRVYELQENALKLIIELNRPENKLKESELGSDKPGRYNSSVSTGGGGAYAPHTKFEDVQDDDFAREVALKLDEARNQNSYNELIIVMPAQIEGMFSKHLNKNVKELVKFTIHKNLMHLSQNELYIYLNKHN